MPASLLHRAIPVAFVLMAAIVASAVAGAVSLGGGRALASHVSCGDTITTDTTLDADLLDCPNNGIVIGADNITLDLSGHTVSGDGEKFKPCREDEFCDVGLLNDGHDGVTVRDGSVSRFAIGAFLRKARDNRVLDVSSSRNAFFGFVVAESAKSVIRDSSGSNNPAPDGDGLGLFGSHEIRVVDNEFRHNHQPGIHVADGSTDNLIEGNLITHSGPGISIEKADRNRVRHNRFLGNIAGVIVAPGSKNVIARNHFSGDGDGIAIEKGRGNLVKRNVIVDPRNNGIYLGLDNPPIGGVDTVVRRNVVTGSGDDGFAVRKKENHSLLKRNVARRSGDDGFDVESGSTKLTRNRATRNADLGIEAVRGMIDGGGNIAGDNGDPRQCVNVGCR